MKKIKDPQTFRGAIYNGKILFYTRTMEWKRLETKISDKDLKDIEDKSY